MVATLKRVAKNCSCHILGKGRQQTVDAFSSASFVGKGAKAKAELTFLM